MTPPSPPPPRLPLSPPPPPPRLPLSPPLPSRCINWWYCSRAVWEWPGGWRQIRDCSSDVTLIRVSPSRCWTTVYRGKQGLMLLQWLAQPPPSVLVLQADVLTHSQPLQTIILSHAHTRPIVLSLPLVLLLWMVHGWSSNPIHQLSPRFKLVKLDQSSVQTSSTRIKSYN